VRSSILAALMFTPCSYSSETRRAPRPAAQLSALRCDGGRRAGPVPTVEAVPRLARGRRHRLRVICLPTGNSTIRDQLTAVAKAFHEAVGTVID